ncbi:MAG TPA: TPM domain-containing protein, partial [Candidatus Acidoferrum sp.]|nr:TPM domain-containing protein [Candidatus Acidoferrum sp.]
HERATREQVVVVTLDSLQGLTIEDYGYQLGRHWGIGQKGINNGVLLIVAPKEHKVRIEVGYGLEGTLTDATSSTIIQNYILPAFKRGDFNGGVVAGTQAIIQVLGGNPISAAPSTESGAVQYQPFSTLPLRAKLGIIVTFGLFFGVWGLVIVMVIAGWINHRNDPGRYSGGWSSGGSSDGSFGGGSDGGGFSGGGGSFGGGGASGSW